jgi:hypothetical protein
MSEVLAQRFARQLVAAVDAFLIARGEAAIPERREFCFDLLTDGDPDLAPGALGRILDRFPPATFSLDDLPLLVIHGNPSQN